MNGGDDSNDHHNQKGRTKYGTKKSGFIPQ
jgi:hypothetical protein